MPSSGNVADLMTKVLTLPVFSKWCELIGLQCVEDLSVNALLAVGSLSAPQCPHGHGELVLVAMPLGTLSWMCQRCSVQVSWQEFAEGQGFGDDEVVLPCRAVGSSTPAPVVINIQASGGRATAEVVGPASSSTGASSSSTAPVGSTGGGVVPKSASSAAAPTMSAMRPTENQLNYIRLPCVRLGLSEEVEFGTDHYQVGGLYLD